MGPKWKRLASDRNRKACGWEGAGGSIPKDECLPHLPTPEWLKLKRLIPPNVAEDVANTFLVGV